MSAAVATGCGLQIRGVGGADDPVARPRDDEQDRLLGLQDQAGVAVDPSRGTTMCTPLVASTRRPPSAPARASVLVRPHARRVDDGPGPDPDASPVSRSTTIGARDRSDPWWSPSSTRVRDAAGAPCRRRGADEGRDQAGVVHGGVPVADRAGSPRRAARSGNIRSMCLREVTVEREGDASRGPRPACRTARCRGRRRPAPTRGARGGRGRGPGAPGAARGPLMRRSRSVRGLADQVEVEHLEVAQTTVDHLLDRLDVPDAQSWASTIAVESPLAHGVEGDAGPGHAAADHETSISGPALGTPRRSARGRPAVTVAVSGSVLIVAGASPAGSCEGALPVSPSSCPTLAVRGPRREAGHSVSERRHINEMANERVTAVHIRARRA